MDKHTSFQLLAIYNKDMNVQFYDCAAKLSDEELYLDRGAFFESIWGTLNHLLVGDVIWLNRFFLAMPHYQSLRAITEIEAPTELNQILCADLELLSARREWVDHLIMDWISQLKEVDVDGNIHLTTMRGVSSIKRMGDVLLHFFNHQTHHRGQLSTLFFQAGIDVGVTDLNAWIPHQNYSAT